LKIGVAKETLPGEARVALVPSMVPLLTKGGHGVLVQSGAGEGAHYSDARYEETGATVVKSASELYESSEVVLKVQPPQAEGKGSEIALLKADSVLISHLAPAENKGVAKLLAEKGVTLFAVEFVPRITRAQSMDALSSQATAAGYKAVLLAADHLSKFFPLLMTAAGTIHPANVLILGAGVAGLQAIATAKRLGAKVEAFDPRPAVKEQVESIGAMFVDMELPKEDAEGEGGYAKAMSEEFLKKEQEAIAGRLPKMDVVITTAAIFGKRAPMLITEDMVKLMPEGSIIIDIAAGTGGNCELTEGGKVVEKHGVRVFGEPNLPAKLPFHASEMYSRNLVNLINYIYPEADSEPDFEDEITGSSCVIRGGEIVNETVKNMVGGGG